MQFIDTHIHLQDYKSNNAPQIPNLYGVCKFVCVSAQESDWDKIAALSEENPHKILPAFGLHPWYLNSASDGWAERLEAKLRQFPAALVGECGLDKLKPVDIELQKQVFRIQLDLATRLRRPLLVHAVKVEQELQEFLPDFAHTKTVLHSFSGSVNLMRCAAKFGTCFSFAPSALRRKSFSELVPLLPVERILLESDGPYQGNPSDIPALTAKIAALRGQKVEELTAQIYKNSLEFINV